MLIKLDAPHFILDGETSAFIGFEGGDFVIPLGLENGPSKVLSVSAENGWPQPND
jgi:hypothetical protein